jgi:hypothetical protein
MRQEIISHALGLGAAEDADSGTVSTEAIRAVSALIAELKPLVGELATRALYVRALHLARSSFERPRGTFESISDMLSPLSQNLGAREPNDAQAAAGALLRAFVDLLVSLIGEPLTYRMLRTAWGVMPPQRLSEQPKP